MVGGKSDIGLFFIGDDIGRGLEVPINSTILRIIDIDKISRSSVRSRYIKCRNSSGHDDRLQITSDFERREYCLPIY